MKHSKNLLVILLLIGIIFIGQEAMAQPVFGDDVNDQPAAPISGGLYILISLIIGGIIGGKKLLKK